MFQALNIWLHALKRGGGPQSVLTTVLLASSPVHTAAAGFCRSECETVQSPALPGP